MKLYLLHFLTKMTETKIFEPHQNLRVIFNNLIKNTYNIIKLYTLDGCEYNYKIENTNELSDILKINKLHKYLYTNDNILFDGEIDCIMQITENGETEKIFNSETQNDIYLSELTNNFKIFEFYITYA